MILTFEVPDETMSAVLTYTYSVDDESIAEGVTQLAIGDDEITAYGMDYENPETIPLEDTEDDDDDMPIDLPFYHGSTQNSWRARRRR